MESQRAPDVVTYPDGRLELVDFEGADTRFYNSDLAPVPIRKRRWNTYNYLALWMSITHNLSTYVLAAGLIALGMSWGQAIITIALGNLIVLVPILLNSHVGTKYGIPFPVFARASYGVRGANFAALLRAFVGCGWFGINTWLGGQAIYIVIGRLAGGSWSSAGVLWGQPWTMWLSFVIFLVFEFAILVRGLGIIRHVENWAAPFVLIMAIILLAWVVDRAGGFGPILHQRSSLGWGSHFWAVFFPSLMAMIAFWATLSLNIPDFTRFGGSQRQQVVGQALGLPTTMTIFSLIAVSITSAGAVVYHQTIWDPVQFVGKLQNPFALVFGLITLVVATLAVNVAANAVSPCYDFCNLFPKRLNFSRAAIIVGIIGVLIQPWRLLGNPHIFITTWLGFYGGVLAPVAGVLITDYWLYRRAQLDLISLYDRRPGGLYHYVGGWSWQAMTATVAGIVLGVGGAWSAPGKGPFPPEGLIPALHSLYNYDWLVGFFSAVVIYFGLQVLPGMRPQERTVARREAVE